jgi:hypothetical protein
MSHGRRVDPSDVPFGTAPFERGRYDQRMAIERNDIEERQARVKPMVAEFRAAQQRRMEKHGIGLSNRTRMEQRIQSPAPLPPAKIN